MPALSWLAAHSSSPGVGAAAGSERDAEVARALQAAQPHLARLIQRLLGWPDRHAVEDAVQEALLRAWAKRAQFRGNAAFRTWLHRIAGRTARNQRRSRFRRRRRVDGDAITHDVADPTAPPTAALDQREQHEAVRQLVHALPQRHREVLVLHYLEGHTIGELQEILGLRRNATDARLSRARKAMAEQLAARGWEDLT